MLHAFVQATTDSPEPEWYGCIRTRSILEEVRAATFKRQYLKAPLVHFVAHARSEINAVWAQHGPNACIVLEGDTLFVALDLTSTANLATSTASSLQFSPQIEAIADRVANLIGPVFNGVHLRWAVESRQCRIRCDAQPVLLHACPDLLYLHAVPIRGRLHAIC